MGQVDHLALLMVAGFVLSSLGEDQCIYQGCYCYDDSVDCSNGNFTSLPPSLAAHQSHFTSLTFDINQITTIPAQILPANLTQISFKETPITTIDDTAFDDSALTLTTLSFAGSLFMRIPDAFLHLHALTDLTFGSPNITDWNINAMKNIGQTLETFYFTQNGLQIWPDCIQYFSNLTSLSITGTSIETIPDDTFDSMSNSLTYLKLSDNNLTAVPKALSKLFALEMLLLNQNNIVDITWLPVAPMMRSLMLNYNRISDAVLLSKLFSPYADSLNEFDITFNQLTVIPDFSFLENIGGFYFDGNRINDPYSGSLPLDISGLGFANNSLPAIPSVILNLTYVTQLFVSYNLIRGIRGDEIPQWITYIDMDYNFVTEITDTSFPVNSSLIYLNMNYNPVSQISLYAFKNVPLLAELNIQGSNLTRVPLAFASLVNVNYVDISESSGLICTCLEKDLGPWFQGINEYSFPGDCGETSVYFFFVSLSPSCPTVELP